MPHFTHDEVAVTKTRDLCQRLILVLGDMPEPGDLLEARCDLRELAEKDTVDQEVLQSLQLVEAALNARAAFQQYHAWRTLHPDRRVAAA